MLKGKAPPKEDLSVKRLWKESGEALRKDFDVFCVVRKPESPAVEAGAL